MERANWPAEVVAAALNYTGLLLYTNTLGIEVDAADFRTDAQMKVRLAAAAVAGGGDHLPSREHGKRIIHRLLVLCRSRLSI